MANLAIRNNYNQTQNTQVSSPTVLQNWQLCWGLKLKSGVTLELYHLYLLSLFDLYALYFGSLFGLKSSTRIWETL